jgi:hypothetical protein
MVASTNIARNKQTKTLQIKTKTLQIKTKTGFQWTPAPCRGAKRAQKKESNLLSLK